MNFGAIIVIVNRMSIYVTLDYPVFGDQINHLRMILTFFLLVFSSSCISVL